MPFACEQRENERKRDEKLKWKAIAAKMREARAISLGAVPWFFRCFHRHPCYCRWEREKLKLPKNFFQGKFLSHFELWSGFLYILNFSSLTVSFSTVRLWCCLRKPSGRKFDKKFSFISFFLHAFFAASFILTLVGFFVQECAIRLY